MKAPEVSVIMAVYNAAGFIELSVRSLLDQTFRDFELILVDDASTDSSPEILQELADSDERIKLVRLEQNVGRVRTRNIALDQSTGKYIAVLDADDLAFPDRLQRQIDFLDENPRIFLVGTGAKKIDEQGNETGVHKPVTGAEAVGKMLLSRNCIYHSSVMYRNSEIRYREKFPLSQDYDLYLQILKRGHQLTNLPDCLIAYRIHSKAASWSHAAKQRLFAQKALEIYYSPERYEALDPEEILEMDLQGSTDKTVLSAEIESLFKLKQYKQMRAVCKTYFKHHGYFNMHFLFFAVSFFPQKVIRWIQKHRS